MARELIITRPDKTTDKLELDDGETLLGRSHSNTLCFPDDASLSRKHLKLTHNASGVWAEDLGSKNGTLLNGRRLTSKERMRPGDRLSVGQLTIKLFDTEQAQEGTQLFYTPVAEPGPSATVMTSLEGLISAEATGPIKLEDAKNAVADRGFGSPVVQILFRASRELVGHRPLAELFPLILELSIEAVGGERGVLMVLEGGQLVDKAMHGDGFRISTMVRDKVIKERQSLLVKDMAQEEAFRNQHSISAQNIHTMMAVPLQTEQRVIGLIYVDSRLFVKEFQEDDLNLLTVLANVAATRIEQERLAQLERENKQAAAIQQAILPGKAPQRPGFQLAGYNAPCYAVGGDYYDFLDYADGRVGLVLGDVAGKGMSAALLMSNLQARVQILSEQVDSLAEFVHRLDKSIATHCPSNRFITFFFALYDPETRRLAYCNAGHNPPTLVHADGSVEHLKTSGTVLGLMPELGYDEFSVDLQPGDVLAVYSDGVTEAARLDDEEYGEDRVAEALKRLREQDAEEIVEAMLQDIADFTDDAPAADDVTLMVARCLDG